MKESLTDKVYKLIKHDIITCVLEPGQQIVQSKLSEAYQVSKAPIRGALQRLIQEGYLQPLPRFGYIVTPITISDVRELSELRYTLEVAAGRLAVKRGSDEELKGIAEAAEFSYIYEDPESYSKTLGHHSNFHSSIALVGKNRKLAHSISAVLDELTRVFHLGRDLRASTDENREAHHSMVKALLNRDEMKLEEIARNRMKRTEERIIKALNRRGFSELEESLRSEVEFG